MQDLISRQAAINECNKRGAEHIGYAISKLPSAQPEPHWIPCSERLPEADERVLVTTDGYDYYVWDCMPNRGDNYFWEDESGFYHDKHEVIAWMPLPAPYQGEGDSNDRQM